MKQFIAAEFMFEGRLWHELECGHCTLALNDHDGLPVWSDRVCRLCNNSMSAKGWLHERPNNISGVTEFDFDNVVRLQ